MPQRVSQRLGVLAVEDLTGGFGAQVGRCRVAHGLRFQRYGVITEDEHGRTVRTGLFDQRARLRRWPQQQNRAALGADFHRIGF